MKGEDNFCLYIDHLKTFLSFKKYTNEINSNTYEWQPLLYLPDSSETVHYNIRHA